MLPQRPIEAEALAQSGRGFSSSSVEGTPPPVGPPKGENVPLALPEKAICAMVAPMPRTVPSGSWVPAAGVKLADMMNRTASPGFSVNVLPGDAGSGPWEIVEPAGTTRARKDCVMLGLWA
ncbi:hypothetical protein J4558_22420 [Leptolyngbya sp. 15MV]|nr:hypothetical protein J4558_22420 [Leptolyngbya sp. 15MV]